MPVCLFVPCLTARVRGRSNPLIVAGSPSAAEDYHCNEQARLLTVGMEGEIRNLILVTHRYRLISESLIARTVWCIQESRT